MIYEVKGDILLSHAQVIAHGVAPNDHFDQGLALSLREQWPAMVKDYRHFCRAMPLKSGDTWIWSGAINKRIVNLLTHEALHSQHNKSGRASAENISHALSELRSLLENERFTSLALPRCRCLLRRGMVHYRIEWPGLSITEKEDGYVLPCVAYPLSDLVLDEPRVLLNHASPKTSPR